MSQSYKTKMIDIATPSPQLDQDRHATDSVEVLLANPELHFEADHDNNRIARKGADFIIVQGWENRKAGSETYVSRSFPTECTRQFIDHYPDAAAYYGYVCSDQGMESVLTLPDLEKLNQLRASLPSEVGVNSAPFVEVNEGALNAWEYLQHFADRQVPMSVDNAEQQIHDLCAHSGGFSVMSEDMFDFVCKLSQDAIDRQDRGYANKVTSAIDIISGRLTHVKTDDLESIIKSQLRNILPYEEADRMASALAAKQREVLENLEAFAASQQE